MQTFNLRDLVCRILKKGRRSSTQELLQPSFEDEDDEKENGYSSESEDDGRPDSVDDKVRKKEMRKGIDLATTLERIEKNFVITDPRLPDNPIVSRFNSDYVFVLVMFLNFFDVMTVFGCVFV